MFSCKCKMQPQGSVCPLFVVSVTLIFVCVGIPEYETSFSSSSSLVRIPAMLGDDAAPIRPLAQVLSLQSARGRQEFHTFRPACLSPITGAIAPFAAKPVTGISNRWQIWFHYVQHSVFEWLTTNVVEQQGPEVSISSPFPKTRMSTCKKQSQAVKFSRCQVSCRIISQFCVSRMLVGFPLMA